MNAVIVSGGSRPSKKLLEKYLKEDDYLIAADSGCECLYDYDIMPNLLVGDFDSVDKNIFNVMKQKVKEIKQFPPEKDYTDTEIAIMEAKKQGATNILLFGATGSRIDHMLGNIGLILTYKKQGIRIEIIDDHNRMYLSEKHMALKGTKGENIGFHALSDVVKNFTIKGAKYNLPDGIDMHLLDPRAICNEFIGTDIELNFDEGELLIFHSID